MLATHSRKQNFSIQKLEEQDLEIFKSMRLESLFKEPYLFGSTFERESQMSDSEWLERLKDRSRAYFVLKLGDECVGLTGILTNRENLKQAILVASYIREEHRRKGGSSFLYESRLDWARNNGFSEVIVSHRASNESSRRANQKHGFEYTHSEPHTWNDGVVELNVFYRLQL